MNLHELARSERRIERYPLAIDPGAGAAMAMKAADAPASSLLTTSTPRTPDSASDLSRSLQTAMATGALFTNPGQAWRRV